MKHQLNKDTVLINDKVLPELEINRYIGFDDSGDDLVLENNVLDRVMDEESMIRFLKDNPRVANELVSYTGQIVYVGRYRNQVGMNFLSRTGKDLEGSNAYGIFLEKCRDRFIREMMSEAIEEKPVKPSQITVDYIPTGSDVSDIEMDERNGSNKYVHVGLYRPAVKYHDTDLLTGTSGHARRTSSSDVKFQTFECPFGLTKKHRILVENAAAASMYYEQAIRGELDWKALFADLRRKGFIKGIPKTEESQIIDELNAQFGWMREQILRDPSLASKFIVADSMVISDKSMGRSVYHPDLAPSPAHVLARYINNPHLLYSASENSVIRAIERQNKDEAVRFSTVSGKGELTIVVDGSDTIGGRVPGTRAIAKKKRVPKKDEKGQVLHDREGNIIFEMRDVNEFEFKSAKEVEIDYNAFAERMDTILMNIDPNVKVRFVSGMNVGTDKMLAKYVSSHGGNVYDWNYTKRETHNTTGYQNRDKDARFSVVRMRNFTQIYPALVGRQESVVFNLNELSDSTEVQFSSKDMPVDGFVSYSVSDDARNRYILERGSLAANSGKPFLHVIDNSSETEQKLELDLSSENTKYSLLGEPSYKDSIFSGEVRKEWNLDNATVMSHMPSAHIDIAIPFVANNYDVSVFVQGTPYRSVFAVYTALLMKNCGIEDRMAYRELAQEGDGMISMQGVYDRYLGSVDISDEVKEKCMRNAVHMMTRASSRFSDSILETGSSDIVSVSSFGDPVLFTDVNGKGENRFGQVLMSERDVLLKELELSRLRDEEEARRIAAEMLRRQNKVSLRASGEKIASGLPRNMEEAMDGIWFLGTSQPVEIALNEDNPSFVIWEEGYNEDVLNREKASRAFIEDVEGNRISNDYVYFFPSSLSALANRVPVSSDPNQRDLTGVTRVSRKTGEEYQCAYGIAVKRNRDFYEHNNKFGKACSFLMDNDGATLANSIYAANAEARATALRHGLALCYSAYSNKNGDLKDSLSRVFEAKVWDYERTKEIFDRNTGKITQEAGVIIPKEITVRKYDKDTRTVKYETELVRRKGWVENPHAAPKNLAMVKRFESMLQNGSQYPLTCFSLPHMDYEGMTSEQFMNDLNFALNMANATALATGKPLRFPLDKEGRINLGPGIPEEFREMAERRIDHYIGVVRDEKLIEGKIPIITRIPVSKAFSNDRPLERDGSDVILRPNDLLVAFGQYDFHDILVGNKAPMHEMAFKDDEGNIFKMTDTRFSSKFTKGEINKYLSYERNDECRFNVRSSDPSKIPAFIQAVKSYVARAKEIKVEYRLFSEEECRNAVLGLTDLSGKGFVHLLASNDDNYDLYDNHVLSARPNETMLEMNPDWVDVRGREGREDDQGYAGKVTANDGFKGWAIYRYELPDGTSSWWRTIDDLEFAKDIILSSVKRVYNTDTRILPAPKVIDATLKSYAVKDCGEALFNMKMKQVEIKADDKVISLPDIPSAGAEVQDAAKDAAIKETANMINVHYGSGDNPELSNFAIRPFWDEVFGQGFQSVEQGFQYVKADYSEASESEISQYKEKILATTDGKELRALGRTLPCLDKERWDKESPAVMRELVMSSFEQNTTGREALLATGDSVLTHCPDDSRWGKLFPEILMETRRKLAMENTVEIMFTESAGGYQKRTWENAQADDVDFTLAFAVDFNTHGEKCTAKAAGDSLIAIDLPMKKTGGLDLSQRAINSVVSKIVDSLPEEYIDGTCCGLNIAGNGIYTLEQHKISQNDIDRFLCAVGTGLITRGVTITSVRTGGQTGVDEAGAVMGKTLGIDTTVHAPNGWVYRCADGKDRRDQEGFTQRFATKDYKALRTFVEDGEKKSAKRSAKTVTM